MPSRTTRRKAGAPLGNRNALKHGFYSKQFKKSDLKDLEGSLVLGLEEEISLLRLLIRAALVRKDEIEYFDEYLDLIRTISAASGCLTRLIKTQYWLSNDHDDTASAINQALAEVAAEFGIIDSPEAPNNLPKPTKTYN